MATKVKPSRLQITGTPQAGNVPVYVDEDNFQWGAGGGGGSGDVVGPNSATDGHLAVFDGTTGKLIKDGGAVPTGTEIVYATQAEYIALLPGAASDGKHYFIYQTDSGWQPGANTVAYYPLTTNANDTSGNNNDLTADSSITYSSNGAYMPNSNHTGMTTPFTRSVSGTTTISMWRKGLDDGEQADQRDIDYSPSGSNRFIGGGFYNRAETWNCMIGSTWTANTTMNYDTWQLLTVTIDNGDVTVYINGTQTFTGTMSSGDSAIVFGNDSGADRHWYGYMKDIIIENVVWTSTEVLNYFNQTKGDYGIS